MFKKGARFLNLYSKQEFTVVGKKGDDCVLATDSKECDTVLIYTDDEIKELLQKGELGIKIAGTLLTKSVLVERLWELSQEIKLSDELCNETVLLPQPLPINDKTLTGEVAEKWQEYDIAALLQFIADMCEE